MKTRNMNNREYGATEINKKRKTAHSNNRATEMEAKYCYLNK
jgi:hypothetical protein